MSKANRLVLILLLSLPLLAGPEAGQLSAQNTSSVPIYRITVVGRTVPAINYRTLAGTTQIDFDGTRLMPKASGKARVTSRLSATTVQANFKNLDLATAFGPQYLTYVLWAITPDGRATNIAEIIPHNGSASLNVTVNFQAFGLIVTAEPYFAVNMPSDVVVMQNQVTSHTRGKIEEVNAKYQLLRRGEYTARVNPAEIHPFNMSPKVPLALYEAQNAVDIARWAGAEQYASSTFDKATQLLNQAEAYQARKAGNKPVIMTAREAAQTAEDARIVALRNQRQLAEAQRRQAEAQQTALAQQKAQQDAAARAQAEAAQAAAEAAREKAQAEAEKSQAEAQQAQLRAQEARQRAQLAEQAAVQAENQRTAMRNRLLQQLNSILQTRQTPGGLVVTMSHVLFNTSKYTLHQETRETLAKIAGVLLAYPGLKIQVNGYTDDTGSEQFNQTLSQQRADAVRTFLVQEGIAAGSVSAQGLGESNPVAPNDTVMGRALNRRVEIVISGEAIGLTGGGASAANQQ
jgi:outer membrane protein OmpA-like peptidoglycan-associated protein